MPKHKSLYHLWLVIPALTTMNQSFIKMLALQMKDMPFGWDWLLQATQTWWIAGILLCEILSFVLWISILASTSISKATPITAIAYIMILAVSWTIFKEPVKPMQVVGSMLILAGVWLIGTAEPKAKPNMSIL